MHFNSQTHVERDEQIMNDNKIEERREREGKPEQQVKAKWNNKIMTCAGLTGSGRGCDPTQFSCDCVCLHDWNVRGSIRLCSRILCVRERAA